MKDDTTGSPPVKPPARADWIVPLLLIALLILNIALDLRRMTTPPVSRELTQQTRTQYEKTRAAAGALAEIAPRRMEQTRQKEGEIARAVKEQNETLPHADIADRLNLELGLPGPGVGQNR